MGVPVRERAPATRPSFGSTPGHPLPATADIAPPRQPDLAHVETPHGHSTLSSLLAADVLALSAAVIAGQLINTAINGRVDTGTAIASLVYVPGFLAVMACYGLYRRGRRRLVGSSFPDIGHLVHSLIVGSLLVLLVSPGLHGLSHLPYLHRTAIAFTAAIAACTVPILRAIARWARARRQTSRVLIIGSGRVASTVIARLSKVDGVNLVGCVDDNELFGASPLNPAPVLGGLADIPTVVAQHQIDHIVVAFSPASSAKLAELLRSLSANVRISVVPRLFDLLTVRSAVDEVYGLPVVDVAPAALGPADRFTKRALDICVCTAGLLVASLPAMVIAVLVRLSSPGPVFFRQHRIGRDGKPFEIYKFRTMRVGAEQQKSLVENQVDGPLFKSHCDPRVTKVGALLRKTSLDELPQLLNVLKGDMSLVGPRPFVISEAEEIGGFASRRFDVRPGMTGLWQVSGRNDLPFAELCRLDYSYVTSWSLWWDLRILWHTPATVLRRRGAY